MVTMTKKQLRQADDEWVVVGLKESKSVERGWVIVADKTKKSQGPAVEEPERVDKILARWDTLTSVPTLIWNSLFFAPRPFSSLPCAPFRSVSFTITDGCE